MKRNINKYIYIFWGIYFNTIIVRRNRVSTKKI